MKGVRLRLAYDGGGFHGWQRQAGLRTVQGALEEAILEVCGHALGGFVPEVRGASRTDAGVHAEGQAAAFDCPIPIPPRGWLRALNKALPQDIVIHEVDEVRAGYNPRFDAIGKRYRYLFLVRDLRCPMWRGRTWLLDKRLRDERRSLDLPAMQEAAARLVGEHDFRAFRASSDPRESSIRTLTRVELTAGFAADPTLWALHVEGTAFLQHMVRIVAGTLVEVGRRRLSPEDVSSLLGPAGDRRKAGPTAPPHGLSLLEVRLGRLAPDGPGAPAPEGGAPAR